MLTSNERPNFIRRIFPRPMKRRREFYRNLQSMCVCQGAGDRELTAGAERSSLACTSQSGGTSWATAQGRSLLVPAATGGGGGGGGSPGADTPSSSFSLRTTAECGRLTLSLLQLLQSIEGFICDALRFRASAAAA
eukprot:768354-Hanusia_phi.AAC.5